MIVVILPDGGRNYLSKLYNDEWMRANGLLATTGAVVRVGDLLARPPPRRPIPGRRPRPDDRPRRGGDRPAPAVRHQPAAGVRATPTATPRRASSARSARRACSTGRIRDPAVVERTVGEVMDRPLPPSTLGATLDEAFALLSGGAPALVAVRGGRPAGVVTKLDLLEYLAHRTAG